MNTESGIALIGGRRLGGETQELVPAQPLRSGLKFSSLGRAVWHHMAPMQHCGFDIPLSHDVLYDPSGMGNRLLRFFYLRGNHTTVCTKYEFFGFPHHCLRVTSSCIFPCSPHVGPSSCVTDSVEIHDSG